MKKILDIHAHWDKEKPQREDTLYSLAFSQEKPDGNYYYSVGIHPWYIPPQINWTQFEELLSTPAVLAIGECGLDKLHKETSLEQQIACFEKQIEFSEVYKKPLIIHLVKAYDELIKLHKIHSPQQDWIIHGFRGNPSVYEMLRKQGLQVSIGAKFNADTLNQIPLNELLIETDTANTCIEQVCRAICEIKKITPPELIDQIHKNTTRILLD